MAGRPESETTGEGLTPPGPTMALPSLRLFEQNLSVLLERDPALAGQIQQHPQYPAFRQGQFPPCEPDSQDLHNRMNRSENAPIAERATVILGLSDSVLSLRALSQVGTLLVVEPELDHFIGFMARYPVLSLLLVGRLLIAQSPEVVGRALSRYGTLTMIVHPGRIAQTAHFRSRLETDLLERMEHVKVMQQRNKAGELLKQLQPDEPVARFFERFEPEMVLDPDKAESFITQNVRFWSPVERIFITLNCFR